MRIPASTYRLQLHESFTFADAQARLEYLQRLGVDWIYLSPVLQAARGSDHGYDVTDPTRIDESRGGTEAFESLCHRAHELGMGVLVDIVPNHQGVARPIENPAWWDLLKHGRESTHARTFDVDWEAGEGRIRIPVIGDGDMPATPGGPLGSLSLGHTATGEQTLRYHDIEYPIAPGTADDTDDPQEVHGRQHYRLMHWRQGDTELNYRRFFTITSLAGVRVEDPEVYAQTHAEIFRWVREGLIDGLRIDHIDGLRDPAGYLERLRADTGLYIVVEKILASSELLPADWACDGTTGYEAIGDIDRVLVDRESEEILLEIAFEQSADDIDNWRSLVHRMKRDVVDGPLLAEVYRICRELTRSGIDHPHIVDAVSEVLSNFRVYRSYVPKGLEYLEQAAVDACDWRPDLIGAIERILPALRDPAHPAAARFQQTSAAVMAKGVEDRAFFRVSRLTSQNEVGSDPNLYSLSRTEFYARQAEQFTSWPNRLTSLTTHDTKRSEDVRARINVLSEMPDQWRDTLEALEEAAPIGHGQLANLIWQSVIGVWPASRERLHTFAEKAAREAGEFTNWLHPNHAAERSLHDAIDAIYDNTVVRELVAKTVEEIRPYGFVNSLSAKIIQLTLPGVPDVYQGTEMWMRALTDPDNRREVDFVASEAALRAVFKGALPPIDDSGAAKLLVTAAVLLTRRDRRDLFTTFEPLEVTGPASLHAIAFSRGGVATIATRLPRTLEETGGWNETDVHLAPGTWVDQITARTYEGGAVSLTSILTEYPVALLARA